MKWQLLNYISSYNTRYYLAFSNVTLAESEPDYIVLVTVRNTIQPFRASLQTIFIYCLF